MKKLIKILVVVLVCLSVKIVNAANYKINELIPYNTKTSIHTDNFSYNGMYFDTKGIHFDGIKNLTDEKLPVTISVGLFDSNGRNVGVVNYCNLFVEGKDEIGFIIEFEDYYFGRNKNANSVKYMAILDDNIHCKTSGSTDYIGKSVDDMGIIHKEKFNSSVDLLLSILTILFGLIIIYIIYKLLFAKAFKNIDNRYGIDSYDVKERKTSNKPKNKVVKKKEKKNKITSENKFVFTEDETNDDIEYKEEVLDKFVFEENDSINEVEDKKEVVDKFVFGEDNNEEIEVLESSEDKDEEIL